MLLGNQPYTPQKWVVLLCGLKVPDFMFLSTNYQNFFYYYFQVHPYLGLLTPVPTTDGTMDLVSLKDRFAQQRKTDKRAQRQTGSNKRHGKENIIPQVQFSASKPSLQSPRSCVDRISRLEEVIDHIKGLNPTLVYNPEESGRLRSLISTELTLTTIKHVL